MNEDNDYSKQMEAYRRAQAERYQKKKNAESAVVKVGDQNAFSSSAASESQAVYDAPKVGPRKSNNAIDRLELLTWNVDGLDEKEIVTRARNVALIVLQRDADAVFLQEVVPENLAVFRKMLGSKYEVIMPQLERGSSFTELPPYFCVILINKGRLNLQGNSNTEWFKNSVMGRHLLTQRVAVVNDSDSEILLATSHLESTREFSKQRQQQLQTVFRKMDTVYDVERQAPDDLTTVVFGGDLNLRDTEVKAAGQPSTVVDVWQWLGANPSEQYTWDLALNTNVSMPKKVRCRFDRLFSCFRPPSTCRTGCCWWQPVGFKLVGKDLIESVERFPSDHFGIALTLEKTREFPLVSDSTETANCGRSQVSSKKRKRPA